MERDETKPDRISTIKDDVHDGVDEGTERVKAGAEKAKRAIQGDSMPLGDRIVSHVKEAGHDVKAEFDSSKREARDDRNARSEEDI